ncbi:DUF5522 domain-containing protein [Pseudacidobacterium ailaaui]|uniref:DUF5522 domain-containing protein n=1 Tax=Pseudacidobacterium ailaaui TaxID=1382359 RepID=UPI0009DF7254|nr:DUF5522 domain-containing protein [Pseudacidobacterium ailaaui]MBX6360028.1 hypothetical protein [Pseudacidobacterium ailaaui]MCL6463847.1 hypothetical protein [Pseudacidobacterium ailaaui]MDI3253668.1 DUF5522 domain-containing protein [Bacillota bacterium]
MNSPPRPDPQSSLKKDVDYYMDGPFLVFTEAYHLKRGYCCGSGCRHCPWKQQGNAGEASCSDPGSPT